MTDLYVEDGVAWHLRKGCGRPEKHRAPTDPGPQGGSSARAVSSATSRCGSYQRAPINAEDRGRDGQHREGILAAESGAALGLMEDARWIPTVPLVGSAVDRPVGTNSPGAIMVNMSGKAVHERIDALRGGGSQHVRRSVRPRRRPGENIPSWLVFDQQYRDRYIFRPAAGQRIPTEVGWSRVSSSRPTP